MSTATNINNMTDTELEDYFGSIGGVYRQCKCSKCGCIDSAEAFTVNEDELECPECGSYDCKDL